MLNRIGPDLRLFVHLRVPPDRTESCGRGPVGRLLEFAVFVALVDAGRDGRVAEPVRREKSCGVLLLQPTGLRAHKRHSLATDVSSVHYGRLHT